MEENCQGELGGCFESVRVGAFIVDPENSIGQNLFLFPDSIIQELRPADT
jgi:hypothetical protein